MIYKISIGSLILVCAGLFVVVDKDSDGEVLSFIVQGASQQTMQQQITSVGGEVVHTYKVIAAISANLTDLQVTEVKVINPMLTFFNNASVEVSGKKNKNNGNSDKLANVNSSSNIAAPTTAWDTQKPLQYDLDKGNIDWEVTNRAQMDYEIVQIDIAWPTNNGPLTALVVNNTNIQLNSSKRHSVDMSNASASFQFYKRKLRTKGQGSNTMSVQMKFDNITSVADADYQVSVTLADENVLAMGQAIDTTLGLPIYYDTRGNGLSWKTQNTATEARTITAVTFDWPVANGMVNELNINSMEIIENASGGSAHSVLVTPLIIQAGENIKIEMGFEALTSVDDLDYGVRLEFDDGSFEELTTTNVLPIQGKLRDTFFPTLVNADKAHARGITGDGVTVAIIDTGMSDMNNIEMNTINEEMPIHYHNVLDKNVPEVAEDSNGHGTHIASIIANSSPTVSLNGQLQRSYSGIAPDANLVIVKAFDEQGRASYADILKAIEYVIENKDVLNIKVLNLSFSATPSSYYWDDPINQAVMSAWEAGITVVAAAGNQGPDAMTIGVPGNTPYVITVGAVSDNYTPTKTEDDFVTSFSSAGPTFEGFVKPDLVAPGGHVQGLMEFETFIGKNFPIYHDEKSYFVLSGSSQSTAITSGIVALMLQNEPGLSPDDIKCRLMYTAKMAVTDEGDLAYSVFQQGAGLVDAMSAIDESAKGCGNAGMDITADLAGEDHYVGPARRYENDGDFYIPGTEGLDWNGVYQDSQLWGNVRFMSNSQLWGNVRFNSDSQLWGNVDSELDNGENGNNNGDQGNKVNNDSQLWGNVRFNSNSQLWGNVRFNSDSQLWGNVRFFSDSQLWGNVRFKSNSQLWGNVRFNSDSQLWGNIRFATEWVEQE